MIKKLLTTLLLLSGISHSILLHAEKDVAGNHVIIAFDEAGTASWRGVENQVRENIKFFLFDNDGKPLLGEDDYYSIVGFKADCSGEHWDDFVYVKKNSRTGEKLSFIKNDSYIHTLTDNQLLWEFLARYQGDITDDSYSLVSIAKPYMLSALGQTENKPLVKHTYILLITDHRYNGNDYYNELKYFMDSDGVKSHNIDLHNVMGLCYEVEEEYCMRYSASKNWSAEKASWINHYAELFEVKPNQDYLTLPAVIDFAPSVTAKRVKGGKYEITLDLNHANEHFEVNRLQADLYSSGDMVKNLLVLDSLDSFKETYQFKRKEKVSSVVMDADLILKDGFYNSTLLTSETVPGLKQEIEVNFEEDARFLLGLFRLPDWLWIPGFNQYVAAIVLDFIILILVVAYIIRTIIRTNTYKPEKEDIHIRYYE